MAPSARPHPHPDLQPGAVPHLFTPSACGAASVFQWPSALGHTAAHPHLPLTPLCLCRALRSGATSHSFPEVLVWERGVPQGTLQAQWGASRCSLGGSGHMETGHLIQGFKDIPVVSAAHPGSDPPERGPVAIRAAFWEATSRWYLLPRAEGRIGGYTDPLAGLASAVPLPPSLAMF